MSVRAGSVSDRSVQIVPSPNGFVGTEAREGFTMSLSITCPTCQSVLSPDPALAGKKIRCPGCRTVLDVPAPGPSGDENVWAALQTKARPTSGGRVPQEESPIVAPRRADSPLPVGWIVG